MNTKTNKIGNEDFGNRLTEQQCMAMTSKAMERFALSFERSARRWEMIVYPAMIVMMLLAGYGFYQVYTVARDVRGDGRHSRAADGRASDPPDTEHAAAHRQYFAGHQEHQHHAAQRRANVGRHQDNVDADQLSPVDGSADAGDEPLDERDVCQYQHDAL